MTVVLTRSRRRRGHSPVHGDIGGGGNIPRHKIKFEKEEKKRIEQKSTAGL